MNLKDLRDRLVAISDEVAGIQATATGEKRDLKPEEKEKIDALLNESDQVEADIQRLERIEARSARTTEITNASAGRQIPGAQPINQEPNVATPGNGAQGQGQQRSGMRNTIFPTAQERGRWGWLNFGDFALGVMNAVNNPSNMDPRFTQGAATTYGSEGVGADGGFAVPPEWRTSIMEAVQGEDGLLARTDQTPVTGNSMTFPTDESTPWQTTGGILCYWDGEAATINQSKPALKDVTTKLHRLTALVPVTDELLEDAQALGAYISRKAGEKITFKINDAIVNGTGAGSPLGILASPCLVTVSAEGSQTNTTLKGVNIAKMAARMPAASFGRSVWLANQDVIPQIMQLGFVVTTPDSTTVGGAGAIWMPPNGLQGGTAFGQILGRPVVITEACPTLGKVGDIILADLTQYLSVVKSAGVVSTVSIHLFFDQNMTAFRFVMRMNGQPWLSAPITRKGTNTNTLSHFVALAGRP